MTAYEGDKPVASALAIRGVSAWRTPVGTFRIMRRVPNETMSSEGLGIPRNAPGGYYVQNVLFTRALRAGDFEGAERSALRRALLDPDDHRPWLDVASAREKQGALAGALEALSRARTLDDPGEAQRRMSVDRVRLQLN